MKTAGLTAGAELLKSGIGANEIIILEARDYVGGRISVGQQKLCGERLDNGAAWIHGTKDNPLVELMEARDTGALREVAAANPWMHPTSSIVSCAELPHQRLEPDSQQWKRLLNELRCCDDSMSIADALKLCINRDLAPDEGYDGSVTAFVALVEAWCGGSVKNISVSFLKTRANEEFDTALFGDYGRPHCMFAAGSDCLVRAVGGGEKEAAALLARVRLNSVVSSISHDADGAEVTLSSGRVLRASKVCVTCPPAPLAAITFNPPLSERRTHALSTILMGAYKKVQLEWAADEVFWNAPPPGAAAAASCGSAALILLRNERCDPWEYYCGRGPDGGSSEEGGAGALGPYVLLDNYQVLRGLPVLEAVCPAAQGWAMSGRDDADVVAEVMQVVRQHYPNAPDPRGTFVTRWEEDPFSGGAYSYHSVNTSHDEIVEIASAVDSTIYFAGEYTDPELYGSLNAAYNSGLRVAQEMLELRELVVGDGWELSFI